MRRYLLPIAMLLGAAVAAPASAQTPVVVTDPAITIRNLLTAILEETIRATEQSQNEQLARMAQRLSAVTSLAKYRLPGAPEWRIHDFESPDLLQISRAYHAALNYGDTTGVAYVRATNPLVDAQNLVGRLAPGAQRALLARLATLDAADAVAIAGTNDAGRLRFNGRRELDAIEALEADVVDPSDSQSTAAVLDKLNGAGLIGTQQRDARSQLLSAMLEQLLVESKRSRDSEAATLNMQIVQWRTAQALNDAFVAGTGDALKTWKQR
jgi:hypothetical protein